MCVTADVMCHHDHQSIGSLPDRRDRQSVPVVRSFYLMRYPGAVSAGGRDGSSAEDGDRPHLHRPALLQQPYHH